MWQDHGEYNMMMLSIRVLSRSDPNILNYIEALKIFEQLDAVNRAVVEKIIETKLGKDWLKEARKKI